MFDGSRSAIPNPEANEIESPGLGSRPDMSGDCMGRG